MKLSLRNDNQEREEKGLLTEESTEARRVIEALATDRGYTLEALAEEIAGYGHHHQEEALGYFTDLGKADPVWSVLVRDILTLSRAESYRFVEAIMSDVAASVGRPRPPERERDKERRATFTRLVDIVGMTEAETQSAMHDDDLWLAPPELRLDVPDEEAVKEWQTASDALEALHGVADLIGLGTLVAIDDAQRRAEIACARARERVRQAQEEG
jgi:hypothetical protein